METEFTNQEGAKEEPQQDSTQVEPQKDPSEVLKEKILQTDEWVVVRTSGDVLTTETRSAHKPVKSDSTENCDFCNTQLVLFSSVKEPFRLIEMRVCPSCQILYKTERHRVIDETRAKGLRQVMENKTPEMILIVNYVNYVNSRDTYLYARYITDLDTSSSSSLDPNYAYTPKDCEICENKKIYFKRVGESYDFYEHFYCPVCKLETAERYYNEFEANLVKQEMKNLMEIFNNKTTTKTQFHQEERCRSYIDRYAWYDEKFEIPKEAEKDKKNCKICKGGLIKYDVKFPQIEYMDRTEEIYYYCSVCKMHFIYGYAHEYN